MLYTCLVATHTVELASLNVSTCPAFFHLATVAAKNRQKPVFFSHE